MILDFVFIMMTSSDDSHLTHKTTSDVQRHRKPLFQDVEEAADTILPQRDNSLVCTPTNWI